MKREKKVTTLICAIVLLSVALITFTSCRDTVKSWLNIDSTTVVDSAGVAQQIDAALNPSFASVEDVLAFRDSAIQDAAIDSVFMSLPETTLKNVASVVQRQHGTITKELIVKEYKNNYKVYNSLPDPPKQQKKDTTIVITLEELQALTADSSGGKPYKQ